MLIYWRVDANKWHIVPLKSNILFIKLRLRNEGSHQLYQSDRSDVTFCVSENGGCPPSYGHQSSCKVLWFFSIAFVSLTKAIVLRAMNLPGIPADATLTKTSLWRFQEGRGHCQITLHMWHEFPIPPEGFPHNELSPVWHLGVHRLELPRDPGGRKYQ